MSAFNAESSGNNMLWHQNLLEAHIDMDPRFLEACYSLTTLKVMMLKSMRAYENEGLSASLSLKNSFLVDKQLISKY